MKNILNKLVLIASEVPHMAKDGKNDKQNYKYLSETQVKEEMRPLLFKHKVVFQISSKEKEFIQTGKTANGAPIWLTKTEVTYKFWDAESGEFIEGTYDSQGLDMQDKGGFKAVTAAVKNILMQNFLIPTGDDPEKDVKDKAVKTTTPVAKVYKASDKSEWKPPVHTVKMEKLDENCSFSTGPAKWSGKEQKDLMKTGQFAIKTVSKKTGGYCYHLGNYAGDWDYLKDEFVDYMVTIFGDKTQAAVEAMGGTIIN